jgi:hypothetical protein
LQAWAFCVSPLTYRAKAKRRSSVHHRPWPRNCAGRTFAEDDHAEHLVLGHVLDAAGADDLTVLHDRHAVGEIKHLVDVVADEEDAEALGLELLDELADLRGLGRPQRRLMRRTEALQGVRMAVFRTS